MGADRVGVRRDPLTGGYDVPDEATMRRPSGGSWAASTPTRWMRASAAGSPTGDGHCFARVVGGSSARRRRRRQDRPGRGRHNGRQPHLLAAFDTTSQAVLAQREVDTKTNEITGFEPLLADLDLDGMVVTADALSRRRDKASYAEVVVMPMWRVGWLLKAVTALAASA